MKASDHLVKMQLYENGGGRAKYKLSNSEKIN